LTDGLLKEDRKMPKKNTKKTPPRILKKEYADRPDHREDMIIYSIHPHTPTEMIYFKRTKKDLICMACGADVEDRVEEIRQRLKKCMI
jgi:putative component of toxin-antitoxin plasmid stabilization module